MRKLRVIYAYQLSISGSVFGPQAVIEVNKIINAICFITIVEC